MSIMKDLFIEEYDKLMDEAEEAGVTLEDTKAYNAAHARSIDRFAGMIDAARERAKYGQ